MTGWKVNASGVSQEWSFWACSSSRLLRRSSPHDFSDAVASTVGDKSKGAKELLTFKK